VHDNKTISIRVFQNKNLLRGISLDLNMDQHVSAILPEHLLYVFVKENGSNQGNVAEKLTGKANVIKLSGNSKALVDLRMSYLP
jgi:hypothetical protein